jgi:hypothetical protein
MRKLHVATMTVIALLSMQLLFGAAAYARSGHTGIFTVGQSQYVLDGQSSSMDVAPVINSGRAFVPVRYLAYALGLTADDIGWDPGTSSADIAGISSGTEVMVKLTIGSATMQTLVISNPAQNLTPTDTQMDVSPQIINGRVYLPARYVVEAFGGTVNWNAGNQTITVTSNVSSCYASWTTAAPSSGQFTALLPGIPVPVSTFYSVGGVQVATSQMVSQCGLVTYEVGYLASTTSVTGDVAKGIITGVCESTNSTILSTNDVILSGLPTQEVQMLNENSGVFTTLCVCYQGSMLWFLVVGQSTSIDVTTNAMKFFDSFKLDAQPNGQTTVLPPNLQSITGNSSGNGSNGPILNWNTRASNTSQHLSCVAFGNNLFVAVGLNDTILTSRTEPTGPARI